LNHHHQSLNAWAIWITQDTILLLNIESSKEIYSILAWKHLRILVTKSQLVHKGSTWTNQLPKCSIHRLTQMQCLWIWFICSKPSAIFSKKNMKPSSTTIAVITLQLMGLLAVLLRNWVISQFLVSTNMVINGYIQSQIQLITSGTWIDARVLCWISMASMW